MFGRHPLSQPKTMVMDGDSNIQEFSERFEQNKRKPRTDSQAAADDTPDLGVILPSLSPADLIPLDLANEVVEAHTTKGK